MGVYIKGMEMPSGCAECPLEMYYFNTGETRCRATNKTLETSYRPTSYEKRDSDCPLVPVPPHVRLGDLDALIEKVIAKYLEHERKGEFVFAAAEIKQDIVDLISNAPTIIEAEEGE